MDVWKKYMLILLVNLLKLRLRPLFSFPFIAFLIFKLLDHLVWPIIHPPKSKVQGLPKTKKWMIGVLSKSEIFLEDALIQGK